MGFSIGNKGYIGTGTGNSAFYMSDFWEFDPNVSGIHNFQNQISISTFPNPFSSSTTLKTDFPLSNATLTVDNIFGQTVAQIKNINGQTVTFNRNNLPSGLYFVRLTSPSPSGEGWGEVIAAGKLVIADN